MPGQILWEIGSSRLKEAGYLVEKHKDRLLVRTGPNSFPRKLTVCLGRISEREVTRLEEARS